MRAFRFAHRSERIGSNRLLLAFQLEQLLLADFDCGPDQRERPTTDQHLARSRGLLQPRSDIQRVPGRQPLLRTREHLARVDPDPTLHAQLRQRIPHLHGSATRPECIVLVRHRNPEHRHHRIADELVHRAAVRFDDPLHSLEVASEHSLERFRIDRLPKRRRADHVAEQHRHHLPVTADRHEPQARTSTRPRLASAGSHRCWSESNRGALSPRV